MALFRYRAYDPQGKAFVAYIESLTLSSAKLKLLEMQTAFVHIQEVKNKALKKPKASTVLEFTKELEQLLSADVPLYESLQIIQKNFSKDPLGRAIDKMIEDLSLGQSFSNTLKTLPNYFDPLYCTLVEMGEHTGQLDIALKRLSHNLERMYEMRKKIWMATLYPLVLAGFACLVIAVLIYFIIPSIESLFDLNKLSLFSQVVLKTCHHLKQSLWVYAFGLGFVLISIKMLSRKSAYRLLLDRIKLRIPWLNTYIKSALMARFCEVMTLLLKTQVSLSDALKLALNVLNNQIIQQAVTTATQHIVEGKLMSQEFECSSFFSPIVIRLIRIGEQSGELANAFEKAAQTLSADVEKKLQRFMTLLSPIALLIMALIIGTIMVAILIPLTDINALLN